MLDHITNRRFEYGTGRGADRRAGPVGGQVGRRELGQRLGPVGQLAVEVAISLPGGEVRVLDLRPGRVLAAVDGHQLVQDDAVGPAVGDDVMDL